MSAFRQGLGKRIHQLRRSKSLTQDELAALVHVDPKYIGALERAERSPSVQLIERLVHALGIEPYELFMFSLRHSRAEKSLNEEALLNLVRHTDPSARSFVVELVQSALRWTQQKKR